MLLNLDLPSNVAGDASAVRLNYSLLPSHPILLKLLIKYSGKKLIL